MALSINDTLTLADKISFNPYISCWRNLLSPSDTSFLGERQYLRTGEVLQAFHRFHRTDCGTDEAEAGGDLSGGNGGSKAELRRALFSHQGQPAAEAAPDPAAATGCGEPPPLMLIAGLGGTMAGWGSQLLAELSCHREVVILENRGAGLSVDYDPTPATYYTMAESVLQLAEALNLTQPDILGWSTGGDIALILAALHGERVGRVVGLGAMAGSNNTVLPDFPGIFAPEVFSSLSLKSLLALLFPPQDEDFHDAVCNYLGSVFWMPKSTVQVNGSVYAAQYLADVDFTTRDPTIWDALPSVTNPVLLIAGTQDVLVPAVNSQLIAQRIPGARHMEFEDWGHGFKDAKALAAAVNEFLS